MIWFKHDTDANQDAKLQNVLLDYGLEGYGLYWYCIELIAGKVDKDSFTFELEHDARIIARNAGSTPQKVEEMMKYFVSQGLFENTENTITCFKLLKRMDQSMTSNLQFRAMINSAKSKLQNHDAVMTPSCSNHDAIMTESCKKRSRREVEEKRKERESEPVGSHPLIFSNSEIEELRIWANEELNENFNLLLELKKFMEYADANGKRYKNKISAAKLNLRKQAEWAGLSKPSKQTKPLDKKFLIQSEINSQKMYLDSLKKSNFADADLISMVEDKINNLRMELEGSK